MICLRPGMADMPRHSFSVPREYDNADVEPITRGRERMRAGTAVICGLARNVAVELPNTIARIERLGELFADYRVLIYENDSVDETKNILFRWQLTNARVSILSEIRNDPVNLPVRCRHRATRMATYRNQCRDYVAAHWDSFDYVVIIDTDLAGGWDFDGIAHTFGHDDWDFVGSYGVLHVCSWSHLDRLVHYDAWAFRRYGTYVAIPTKTVNRMHWRLGSRMLPVFSCFGGLGVYRMDAVLASRYSGEDCEHVTFHRRMRRRGFGRMFLNPNQITFYGRKVRTSYRLFSGAVLQLKSAVSQLKVRERKAA